MLVVPLGKTGAAGRRLSAGTGVANAVAIQPDGKIVVAGRTSPDTNGALNGDMVIKRFTATGAADRTFGVRGTVRARGAVANAVAIAPGGKIVAGGFIEASDGFPRVAVVRYLANGAPDRTFGTGGLATPDLGRDSQAKSIAVQRDGKVVFGGEQIPDLQAVNALIGRVSSRGLLDRGFGVGGTYFYLHPNGGAASSFLGGRHRFVRMDLGAGGDQETAGPHALFVRLSRAGRPDGGFGSHGVIVTPSASNYGGGDVVGARAIAIAGRGEIVATGAFKDSGLTYAALWGITPRGRLDGRLGKNGLTRTVPNQDLGGESHAVTVARDGSIYSGGSALTLRRSGGFVARYGGFGALPKR